MKNRKIVFYDDCYDNEQLIWKASKEYNIIAESEDLYFCECESITKKKDNKTIEQISYAIEKTILNMYYII